LLLLNVSLVLVSEVCVATKVVVGNGTAGTGLLLLLL